MAVRQEWDIRRVLIVLSRWWWWPALTITGGAVGAWLYLRYTVAIYRSEATIQIEPRHSLSSPVMGKAGSGMSLALGDAMMENYIELFTTFHVIYNAVVSQKFNLEVYSTGRFGNSLIYPSPLELDIYPSTDSLGNTHLGLVIEVHDDSTYQALRGEKVVWKGKWGSWFEWEGHRVRLRCIRTIPPGKYIIRYNPIESTVNYWYDRIQVVPKRGYTVLSVMVADISPARAQAFCKALLRSVKAHEQSIQEEYYNKVLAYLDTLIEAVLTDIERVQDTLRQMESQHNIPLSDIRKQVIFNKYQSYYESDASSRIGDLNFLENQVKKVRIFIESSHDTIPYVILPTEVSDVTDKIAVLNDKIKRYNQIIRQYVPNSAIVKRWREEIKTDIDIILSSIEINRNFLLTKKAQIGKYLSSGLPTLYRDVDRQRKIELTRFEWENRRKMYESLIEQKLRLSIERSGITSMLRLTQPPVLPSVPIYPNRIKIYVIMIMMGAVLGFGGIFLREILTQQVSYRRDIEPISPIPVLGELPMPRRSDRMHQIGVGYFSNLQLEILRSIRGSLEFVWEMQGPRIIIVSSTVSGEGKSYISSALAYVYALAGKRTLLIDADLRRAHITHRQGLVQIPGLSNLLISNLEGSRNGIPSPQLWVPYLIDNLYVLPSGPQPPNAADLLASPLLRKLILEWQSEFDYFVFDTSPLGLVPDALSIISQFPEAINLYVFRADYSRITFLNHLEDIVKHHKLSRVYLLFNGTRISRPHYGYGYGYGYYGDSYGASKYYYTSGLSNWRERMRKWIPL